jgi:hypothetical protein
MQAPTTKHATEHGETDHEEVAILSGAEDLLEEHVVSEADVIAGDSVAMMLGAGAVRLVFQTDPADLSTVAKESV